MLDAFPNAKLTCLDKDKEAIEFGDLNFKRYTEEGRLKLYHTDWISFSKAFTEVQFDAILLDLGVSSPQLDTQERGFSFYKDGQLDMRMNQEQISTAKDIVNSYSLNQLIELFKKKGEVFRPNKVASSIVRERRKRPINTTKELSDLIVRADGWRKKGRHPATQYFQALRLEVNHELEELEETLPLFFERLKDKGRMIVISFHSLEDRIVKTFFQERERQEKGFRVNKKVLKPSFEEKNLNPRSRSAKMRVIEKGMLKKKQKMKNKGPKK